MDSVSTLEDGPQAAPLVVALAHGAGAPMTSPFMNAVAAGLAGHGYRVVRFEFPYMERRRADGRRRPPDRAPVLLARFRSVIDRLPQERLVVGGKSLGGRMASLIAGERGVRALVCLGYPFHPPGRPERTRIAHLLELEVPALIVQGTKDPFGTPAEVAGYGLPASVRVHWIEGGGHGFEPRGREGSAEASLEAAIGAVAAFLGSLVAGPRRAGGGCA